MMPILLKYLEIQIDLIPQITQRFSRDFSGMFKRSMVTIMTNLIMPSYKQKIVKSQALLLVIQSWQKALLIWKGTTIRTVRLCLKMKLAQRSLSLVSLVMRFIFPLRSKLIFNQGLRHSQKSRKSGKRDVMIFVLLKK